MKRRAAPAGPPLLALMMPPPAPREIESPHPGNQRTDFPAPRLVPRPDDPAELLMLLVVGDERADGCVQIEGFEALMAHRERLWATRRAGTIRPREQAVLALLDRLQVHIVPPAPPALLADDLEWILDARSGLLLNPELMEA